MRTALKITALVVGALFALVVIREAFFGYTAYFVIVPGARVYADGKPISGWLHRRKKGDRFIVTRSDSARHESFLFTLPNNERDGGVISCGQWAAPRFPLVAIGDVNPPCSGFDFGGDSKPRPKTPERNFRVGPRFLEFTADDGNRIRTSW